MLLAALALVLSSEPAPACPAELFRIERNKNANVILYEARPGKSAALDPDEPVTATWLLLAGTGGREKLNFVERTFAYGFSVRAAPEGKGYALTLKAFKERSILVSSDGPCPRALATVAGRQAVLTRIYIQADEGRLKPKVRWFEIFGTDAETGEALSEKIVVAK